MLYANYGVESISSIMYFKKEAEIKSNVLTMACRRAYVIYMSLMIHCTRIYVLVGIVLEVNVLILDRVHFLHFYHQ
jgi:hypothetical protein